MPDPVLENLLTDFPQTVRDRFAIMEEKAGEASALAMNATVEANKLRDVNISLQAALAAGVAENARIAARLRELESVAGGAADDELYVPGQTKLREGRRYRLPAGPLNLVADVPVTLTGSPDAPVFSPNSKAAIETRAPCLIDGVTFDHPTQAAPGKKIGAGECILDRSTGTRVMRCRVGNVDDFLFGDRGSVGLLAAFNVQFRQQRGYFAYGQGGDDWLIFGNLIEFGSAIEQPIRTSPNVNTKDSPAWLVSVARRWQIIGNTVRNEASPTRPNPKGCIDLRQMAGGTVAWNHAYSYPGGGAIAIGPQHGTTRPLFPFETGDDIAVHHNDIHNGGMIQTRLCRRCSVAWNELYDFRPNLDNAIGVDMMEETVDGPRPVEDLDIIGNRMYLLGADTSNKPTVRKYGDTSLGGVFERNNVWLRQPTPPPVTVPGGLGRP